jgi:hypothetical protein
MAWRILSLSTKLDSRGIFYPLLEVLEDRCVPAQNIFQYASSVLQGLASYGNQINATIDSIEIQQVSQLQQKVSVADQIAQALNGKVITDEQKFNSDVSSGASVQDQIIDLSKIQMDQETAQAGDGLIAQYNQTQILQTTQQLQADEAYRNAQNQALNQDAANFLNQIIPDIAAAMQQQPSTPASPQVGSPLAAGQTAKYSGIFSVTVTDPNSGMQVTSSVALGVVVTVGSDGVTLTGPASENVSVLNPDGTTNSSTNSTTGSINGRLQAPNGTAANGTFTFTFNGQQPPSAPWTGFLGTTEFVGTTTDPSSGVTSSFELTRVQ